MGRVSVNVDVGVNVIEIPALFLRHLIYSDNSTWTRLSYDAWGRRNAADGSYDNVSAAFDRGYTGHEHLDAFGLINMNGRLYDPMLGRMLSPDIVVQQTDYTQSYNRYSYCFNNPLRFTDPSGYVMDIPIEY